MNTSEATFEQVVNQGIQRLTDRRWNEKVFQLVRLMDELVGEKSSDALREAVHPHGYDIDADTGMLTRRGVNFIN